MALVVLSVGLATLTGCERRTVGRSGDTEQLRQHQAATPSHNLPAVGGDEATSAPSNGSGKVVEIDRRGGRITIQHEPRPDDDWPSMKLMLPVDPPTLLDAIKVGDRVAFHIERREAGSEIVGLRTVTAVHPP